MTCHLNDDFLDMKKRENELKKETPQLQSATHNILPEILASAFIFPCHPCSNALRVPDNPLCTLYGFSDVILQQNVAVDATAVHCFWSFAIVTPVAAVDLKYPVIGASAAAVVVCSFRVITTFPSGQTHPVGQADSPVAIHSEFLQLSGQRASLPDLALHSDSEEDEPQHKESLHGD